MIQSNSRCEIGAKCSSSHNGDNEIMSYIAAVGNGGVDKVGLVTVITRMEKE